jgi:hypothetical protein
MGLYVLALCLNPVLPGTLTLHMLPCVGQKVESYHSVANDFIQSYSLKKGPDDVAAMILDYANLDYNMTRRTNNIEDSDPRKQQDLGHSAYWVPAAAKLLAGRSEVCSPFQPFRL